MAYNAWIDNTMPMVTIVSTLDVTHIVRYSKRHKMRLNMLMLYCIGRAASHVKEFYTFLCDKQFYTSDRLTIQTIVNFRDGGIGFCDMPYCESVKEFGEHYERNTRRVMETGKSLLDTDGAPIYTSCVPNMYIDAAVNQYCNAWPQPFIAWGRYRKEWLWRKKLPVSMQFHHVQMDGMAVGEFFGHLQAEMDRL